MRGLAGPRHPGSATLSSETDPLRSPDRTVRGTSATAVSAVTGLLDRALEEANLDAVLVTSPHNVRYLLGQPPFFFFEFDRAFGRGQYLPILIYLRDRPDATHLVGYFAEQTYRVEPLWVSSIADIAFGTVDAMENAVEFLRGAGGEIANLGIEAPFVPADAYDMLRKSLPAVNLHDVSELFDGIRALKTDAEVVLLREAAERTVDAMLAVFDEAVPGITEKEVVDALRYEEARRGLDFKYCLIATGRGHHRGPSERRLEAGDTVSLDSGASFRGYVADMARMGLIGKPDDELEALLAEIDDLQRLGCSQAVPGADVEAIAAAIESEIRRSPNCENIVFEAHGLGLVGHEGPTVGVREGRRQLGRNQRLQPGAILSIETAIAHPRRGFIKLEDALVVTADGFELFADYGHGWNIPASVGSEDPGNG